MSAADRIPPLLFEEWGDDARSVFPGHLRRPELYLSGAPDALPMPRVLGLFAHHVPLSEAWLVFSDVLAGSDSTMDARLRELVILRVAWRARSSYEWVQHTRMATHAGVTTEQLYAIPEGSRSEVWQPVERALLAAADEMFDESRVSDGTWAALSATFDEPQLLEILFLIGSYLCLAMVLNSVGLDADPPTEPIDAPVLPGRSHG